MTSSLWLRNGILFGLQLGFVIGAGAALARAFRLRAPKVSLTYWQVLLVACLLLPFAQPWQQAPPPAPSTVASLVPAEGMVAGEAAALVTLEDGAWPVTLLVICAVAAGAVARALWLTIGLFRLRRLRRTASLIIPPPPAFLLAEERVGVRASVYVSDRISGPITFGLIHPVVILPPNAETLPSHVQEAIACHELLHVRRRDWLFEIIEEAVRTIFWFHPAVWWLIGRIQLSREQVVDQAAIQLTQSRERYIDALLVVALTKSPIALAPLFLRRSLLKKRVAQILQETTMTTRRLIASLTATAAALTLTATVAVRSFPLEAQGQAPEVTSSDDPVQIVTGGKHLLHGSLPEYPRRALEQRIEGDVQLEIVVDDRGEVTDARVLTGPDELRRAALEAVLQWHYSPAVLRSTSLQATLRFRLLPSDKLKVLEYLESVHKLNVEHDTELVVVELEKALEDPKATEHQRAEWKEQLKERELMLSKIHETEKLEDGKHMETWTVKKLHPKDWEEKPKGPLPLVEIRTERVTPETLKDLVARAGIRVGDVVTEDTIKRVREIAASIDEHLKVGFQPDRKGGLILMVVNP